ncbi:hypothetical protein BDC45DRAFT_607502 [Circinella umbellata]|nr:hypothetical protein BDC45DRAFT_607502 [Circinella umbellata]
MDDVVIVVDNHFVDVYVGVLLLLYRVIRVLCLGESKLDAKRIHVPSFLHMWFGV